MEYKEVVTISKEEYKRLLQSENILGFIVNGIKGAATQGYKTGELTYSDTMLNAVLRAAMPGLYAEMIEAVESHDEF